MDKEKQQFSHIDNLTGDPVMVNVSEKQVTKRSATAQCIIVPGEEVMKHFTGSDIHTKKGPVFLIHY